MLRLLPVRLATHRPFPHQCGIVMVSLRSLLLISCLWILPVHAFSQLVNGRLISSVYAWEKFDTVNTSTMFGRGFQSVLLDITQSDFSFHTHLQGAINLQKTLDETPDFRAWYLYARWKNIAGVADLSFGRLPYFAGVGTGTLDGALTTVHFADDAARLTLYGGAPASPGLVLNDWRPLAGNYAMGGQFSTTAIEGMRMALSYVQRLRAFPSYFGIRPDSLFNPVTTLIEPEAQSEKTAGVDASYRTGCVRLYGRADYNVNEDRAQRAQARIRYDVSDRLMFSGEYIYRRPHIPFGSFFSVFPTSAIQEAEAGLDYAIAAPWNLFVKGALVQYDGDQSFRYTAGVSHRYIYLSYRGNAGLAGELQSVSLQGAYPLFENMLVPNAALTYASYKLDKTGSTENALAAALGATVRPVAMLSLDVQGQWMKNRVFENDVRLFAKLTIWFTEQFHIFP
jgi:hypothetical protein